MRSFKIFLQSSGSSMEANGQILFCAQGHLHGYNCEFGGRTKIVDVHLAEKWLKKTRKGILLIFYLLF